MKLALSMLAYVLMAIVLAYGILSTIHGRPALLIVGLLGYVVMVSVFGCLPKKSH